MDDVDLVRTDLTELEGKFDNALLCLSTSDNYQKFKQCVEYKPTAEEKRKAFSKEVKTLGMARKK